MTVALAFDNSYATLPPRFYRKVEPTPVVTPRLLALNTALAAELGLDAAMLATPDGVRMLAGNLVPDGAASIALAYAGHQFGHFVPQLGDGRAILLGEVVGRDGRRRDIQLKGSGPTPFSRQGDGRAALGPVLREYLVSEAMAALGIPTTRALAAVLTGERVRRETALPGAVLTRVATSHVRVGTFQYFAARGDNDGVRLLADHVIARHYPDARQAPNPYRALLERVIIRQAELVARWLLVGFIHGVMNTDNASIAGETLDFGPCAFIEEYDTGAVFSAIDQTGRYAYGNQPGIAHWNMTRLAECLLPLLDPNEEAAVESARQALALFAPRFHLAYLGGLRRKIGLDAGTSDDDALVQALMDLMAANHADFTQTFRRLCDAETTDGLLAPAFIPWLIRWRDRLAREPGTPETRRALMRAQNPCYIPRNHLVEAALNAAIRSDDLAPFHALLRVLARPFDDQPGSEHYAMPARPEDRVTRTFCGT